MRVLLKQPEAGLYLQPAGTWDSNRDTAREFASPDIAYAWALDSAPSRCEIVLASVQPHHELLCIRVDTVANRPIINCQDLEWNVALYSTLNSGQEVDLVHFDDAAHGYSCKLLARAFDLDFSLNHETHPETAHFRRNAYRSSP